MDLTVGQFVYVIRKRISIPPEKAIFIFVNDTLPPTAALMSTVYETHRDKDGFMCAVPRRRRASHAPSHPTDPADVVFHAVRYMMYGGENTFGELELRDVGEWVARKPPGPALHEAWACCNGRSAISHLNSSTSRVNRNGTLQIVERLASASHPQDTRRPVPHSELFL
eukprot:scaffold204209_cov31-Tisochrysis_lutea.AAC.2